MSGNTCPYCNLQMLETENNLECSNKKCEYYGISVPKKYVEDINNYKLAIEKYRSAIDVAKRFSYGIREKMFELPKATSSSHLIMEQLPFMASACLSTLDDFIEEAEEILKSSKQ